jgi:hypothetical protein
MNALIVALLVPPIVFFLALAALYEQHTGELSANWRRFITWRRKRRTLRRVQRRVQL